MQFIPTSPDYHNDAEARQVWEALEAHLPDRDGLCFYKHPLLGAPSVALAPDLVLLAEGHQPLIVVCVRWDIAEVSSVEGEVWRTSSGDVPSPLLRGEEFLVELRHRFEKQRDIRDVLKPIVGVVFSHVDRQQFRQKFGDLPKPKSRGVKVLWRGDPVDHLLVDVEHPLAAQQWRLAQSAFQGVRTLRTLGTVSAQEAKTFGEAIRGLHKEIALLDSTQRKVAYQIPPGPQRIRGLAGTGKTVLLAMKAANIHAKDPRANVLFTFNTQSLYNQSKALITRFYIEQQQLPEGQPEWESLHVRHAWGGRTKAGVYSDACGRQGAQSLTFAEASARDPKMPFRACCVDALSRRIEPFYDYILVDEAQDFPKEFFHLLWAMSKPPNRIYFAYDELQSLTNIELPSPGELFPKAEDGSPLVTLDSEYESGIEQDLVLEKSYRCPLKVLVFAHAVGLGIHGPRGSVQMLPDGASWRAAGYEVLRGDFAVGDEMVIRRPEENSPNPIAAIYKGDKPILMVKSFESRKDEIAWVAKSMQSSIQDENVAPEQIVAIALDSLQAKRVMTALQLELLRLGIASVIPGLVDGTAEFAEPGRITLSTVHRAKGNEAPLVYVLGFEDLHRYAEELEVRNRAFTCISRAMGWVRLTGSGPRMSGVRQEARRILADLPEIKFVFPDMKNVRRLSQKETTRRRAVVRRGNKAAKELAGLEDDAYDDLDQTALKALMEKARRALERKGRDEAE